MSGNDATVAELRRQYRWRLFGSIAIHLLLVGAAFYAFSVIYDRKMVVLAN